MAKKSFKRGIHPFDGKDYAKDVPIKRIEAQELMVFPLSQHIGAPAKPIVAFGDRVLKGQMIAEAGGFISSPVFSSVSGTVKKAEKRKLANGNTADCIIIENDGEYETVDGFGEERDISSLTSKDIVDIVTKSGIVGLGGAGFPSGVKIAPKNAGEIDTVIINGAECEPYLTSDYRLMLERSDDLVKGIEALLKALPSAKAVIGIENNKPEAIKLLSQKVSDKKNIEVMPLKTKYPQGGERQLIYAVTGRRINSKMLPADMNVVVVNVASTIAIYEAVYLNMPLIHKVMTVTGDAVNSPCNLDVPLGVSHSYVLECGGGAKESVEKFISGGPMMGMAMSSLDVPVIKTSSSILAYTKDEVAHLKETHCIRCGKCVAVCPQFLVPQMMGRAVKENNIDAFEKLSGMECIECGCCTYGCPAKIPLTQMFKLGKIQLREKKAKEKEESK